MATITKIIVTIVDFVFYDTLNKEQQEAWDEYQERRFDK